MKFSIYCSGFQEMEMSYSPPRKMGESAGSTFEEACANFFVAPEDKRLYDPKRGTYWGLKLGPTMRSVCDD